MKHFYLKFLLVVVIAITSLSGYGQDEYKYITPAPYITDNFKLSLMNIVSSAEKAKLKLAIENRSEKKCYVFKSMDVVFSYEIGNYPASSNKADIVLTPKQKGAKVIANAGDHNHLVDAFDLELNCLLEGDIPEQFVEIESLEVTSGQKGEIEMSSISLKIIKVSSKKGKFSFQSNFKFDAGSNEALYFDPSKVKLMTNEGTLLESESTKQDAQLLWNGSKDKFKFTVNSDTKKMQIDWKDAFKLVKMRPAKLPNCYISRSESFFEEEHEVICNDNLVKDEDKTSNKYPLGTVVEITKTHVIYTECKDGEEKSSEKKVPKEHLLGIWYADGTVDHFDFTNDNKKKGMDLVRSRKEMIEKHRLANKKKYEDSKVLQGPLKIKRL